MLDPISVVFAFNKMQTSQSTLLNHHAKSQL